MSHYVSQTNIAGRAKAPDVRHASARPLVKEGLPTYSNLGLRSVRLLKASMGACRVIASMCPLM